MIKRLLASTVVGAAAGIVLDFALAGWALWAARFSHRVMETGRNLGVLEQFLVGGGHIISTYWPFVLPCVFLACVLAAFLVGLATARKAEEA